jgi:hypothetical protein
MMNEIVFIAISHRPGCFNNKEQQDLSQWLSVFQDHAQ